MNCPLCNKDLLRLEDDRDQYHCPETIPDLANGGFRFHYYIRSDGRKYIYVGLYRIHQYNDADNCHIFKYVSDEIDGRGYYTKILEVPAFQVKSAEQVLQKLNTLVVFS